jgi:hypothetical protein
MNRLFSLVAIGPLACLLALTATRPAQAGAVWKCKDGERTIFSDTPCPAQGKQIETRLLQGNVVQAEKLPAKAAPVKSKSARSKPGRAPDPDRLRKQPPALSTNR